MHKAVLMDLDVRSDCCKMSFDVSNAHNEYDRHEASRAVQLKVPDLLPWARTSLSTSAVHVHMGAEGRILEVPKESGGDQGDALTNLIFPVTYQSVGHEVSQAVRAVNGVARCYVYQDDMETVCPVSSIPQAVASFSLSCAKIGLRANQSKMKVSPGRDVDVMSAMPDGIGV